VVSFILMSVCCGVVLAVALLPLLGVVAFPCEPWPGALLVMCCRCCDVDVRRAAGSCRSLSLVPVAFGGATWCMAMHFAGPWPCGASLAVHMRCPVATALVWGVGWG